MFEVGWWEEDELFWLRLRCGGDVEEDVGHDIVVQKH